MKIHRILLAACLAGGFATGPLSAQEASMTPPEALRKPISLDLVDAVPADVFASFGEILGREAVVDPAVTTPVTIRLQKVTVGTALRAICESIGCLWRLEPERLTVQPRPPGEPAGARAVPLALGEGAAAQLMSMSLRGTRAGDVFGSFERIFGFAIEVAPEVAETRISVELQDVPAREVFEVVLDLAGAEAVELSAEPRRLAVRKRE